MRGLPGVSELGTCEWRVIQRGSAVARGGWGSGRERKGRAYGGTPGAVDAPPGGAEVADHCLREEDEKTDQHDTPNVKACCTEEGVSLTLCLRTSWCASFSATNGSRFGCSEPMPWLTIYTQRE